MTLRILIDGMANDPKDRHVLVRPPVEPFEPVTWVPSAPAPVFSQTSVGSAVRALTHESVNGPEDIAVDAHDRRYVSTRDGVILRIDPNTGERETFAEVGGRPLGLQFAPSGELLVANQGLGRVWVGGDRAGHTETHVDNVPGISDGFTRAVDGRLILATYQRVEALDEVILPSVIARHAAVRLPDDLLSGDPLPGAHDNALARSPGARRAAR